MRWRDVSTPIRSGMPVYPGDPEVRVERAQAMARGDTADVTALSLGAHAGTHVDAPAHVLAGAPGVEALDPGALIGPAVIADAPGDGPIGPGEPALDAVRAGDCRRLLLRTGPAPGAAPAAARGLDAAAARLLVARGVVLVGTDAMSIAPADDPLPAHRILLQAGVAIVEGLDLRGVDAGPCTVVCLPLLIPGADGAPARVLVGAPGGAL